MAATTDFNIGDEVELTFRYVRNSVLTDPDTATGRVLQPDGSTVALTLARQTAGVYTATFSPTLAGEHWARGEGTGAAKCAQEHWFNVRKRRVPAG